MSTPPGLLEPFPRQKATVYLTAADLANDPGPLTTVRYAIVLALGPEVFRWVYGDVSTADDISIIEPATGGGLGRWIRTRAALRGEDLATGNQTIAIAGNRWRVIPAATILGNSIITIDDAGAVEGDEILITRNGTEAFTVTIANGGAGGGNIVVMPSGVRSWALSAFDGTDWIHKASGLSLAAT